MNASPMLSVIIVCYNYQRFVGRAIESVLAQNEPRCELLVVDDGSTDGSWEVIRRYDIAKCVRLANGGAARASAHAFARSDGAFILFLDADDELAPGSLARIIGELDPGVSKLQFPLTPIDAENNVLGDPVPRLADFRRREVLKDEVLRTGSYTSPPTSGNVFSRALCMLLAEVDYETWVDGVTLFAAPFYGDVVSLSVPLGFYRLHGANHSQSGSRPSATRFAVEADRFLARLDHLNRILERLQLGLRAIDGRRMFFYRERRLYQTVLEGRRPALVDTLAMGKLLLAQPGSLRYRATMAVLVALLGVLPARPAAFLLAYRFKVGKRTALGLLRELATSF